MEPLEPLPETVDQAEVDAATSVARRVGANIRRAVQVRDSVLQHVVVALLAEGHVLVEDYPGVGKTALARALSRTIDCQFARVQCTADLLPADIVGTNVYNQREARFEFRPGPVFANMLLVDEINRASPKTQAALLECMQENQVTIDGTTYELARPFMVMATQNPIEYEGTYPLPEAQLDRFTMRVSLGYPEGTQEARMLTEQTSAPPLDDLEPVASALELVAVIDQARAIYVEESLNRYIVALLRNTRSDKRLYLGASPRAGIALLRVAKARALAAGREFVLPDDVKAVAEVVLAHRLILAPEAHSAGLTRAEVVREVLQQTPVPV